jgi:DDE superfamily endonuclease
VKRLFKQEVRPMVVRIVENSAPLIEFLTPLISHLTRPQQRHLVNFCDSLLVCETEKTLAALKRQFLDTVSVSNWADFLRISPWSPQEVRAELRKSQVAFALAQAEANGSPKEIFINIDDSLGEKDKATWRLEPVDWHHDHTNSTPNQQRYKNSFCYLVCTVRIGKVVVTTDVELYLRSRTVRSINRHREPSQRLSFRSKNSIAREMLSQLELLLPEGWEVIIQFDSWYASAKLQNFIRRRSWNFTCAVKSNRNLNGTSLKLHARQSWHKRYERIGITAADGASTTYCVRQVEGRLSDVPTNVRVFISQRHRGQKSPAFFATTRLGCKTQSVLQGYSGRWSCEVVNFYLKTQLGLADFRVRSFEACDKYVVAVHLAWAYIEQQYALDQNAQVKTYGDLIRRHRDQHAAATLKSALTMAQAGASIDEVLSRFIPQSSVTA